MFFELVIAWSHLRSRKQDAGISLIATLSVMGVTVGVAVLIMVLSVMAGFEVDLRDKILGSNSHLVVLEFAGSMEGSDKVEAAIEATDGVIAASPFVYTEVMIRSRYGTSGAVLKGIDPIKTPDVTDIGQDLKLGPKGKLSTDGERRELIAQLHAPPRSDSMAAEDQEQLPGIFVGEELSTLLRVFPGDRLWVINPIGGGVGPLGMPIPTTRTFRVAGVFYTGMYEYDTKWTYVALQDAQEFLSLGTRVTGVEAKLEEARLFDVQEIREDLLLKLEGPYVIKDWLTMNAALFSALKLEKYVMGLILILIVLVAALGIVTNLTVMVITRAREIAILRAMGASSRNILWIFVMEGGIVGVTGTSLGTVLGLAGCLLLDRYRFPLDTNVYYLDSLPVVVEPASVATTAVAALVICFTATLYPALRAARLAPVDGLRYE